MMSQTGTRWGSPTVATTMGSQMCNCVWQNHGQWTYWVNLKRSKHRSRQTTEKSEQNDPDRLENETKHLTAHSITVRLQQGCPCDKKSALTLIAHNKGYNNIPLQTVWIHLCKGPCINDYVCVLCPFWSRVGPGECVLIVLNCGAPDLHIGDAPPVNGCTGAWAVWHSFQHCHPYTCKPCAHTQAQTT